jgi:hypothetical protein
VLPGLFDFFESIVFRQLVVCFFSQYSKSCAVNVTANQTRSALSQVQQSQKQTAEVKTAPLNDRLLQSTDKNRRPVANAFSALKPNYMQTTRAFSHRQLNPARYFVFK